MWAWLCACRPTIDSRSLQLRHGLHLSYRTPARRYGCGIPAIWRSYCKLTGLCSYMFPVRRSRIRPPKRAGVALDSSKGALDFAASWKVIADAITQIQNKNVSTLLYEQLYRVAYTLVLHKFGENLYNQVSETIASHLQERRHNLLASLPSANSDDVFLEALAAEWSEHLELMRFVNDILMYLNRVYVQEQHKHIIYDQGMILFADNFLSASDFQIANALSRVLYDKISAARSDVTESKVNLVKLIAMFETVSKYPSSSSQTNKTNLYFDIFEKHLLARSEQYYTAYADDSLASLQGTKYIHDIHNLIKDEERLLQSLASTSTSHFRTSTYPNLVTLMNQILIKVKLEPILTYPMEMQGLLYWLEEAFTTATASLTLTDALQTPVHAQELRILYELEGRIDPDRTRLKTHLRECIVAQGFRLPKAVLRHLESEAALATTSSSKKQTVSYSSSAFVVKWIDVILVYQAQLLRLVQSAFEGSPAVEFTVLASIKQFINAPEAKVKKNHPDTPSLNAAELLSVYMDHHIKQFTRNLTVTSSFDARNEEVEAFFRKAIGFVKLIEDKYAFEAHYAAHFAKRFLNSKSGAINSSFSGGDLEDLSIAKLWEEVFMGSHYLERIVKMRKDATLSEELTMEWRNKVSQNALQVVDLELKVCNLSEWPKAMTKDYASFTNKDGEVGFIWPSQLRETIKMFEEFWLTGKRNDNKVLYWYPRFGLMDLRITYPTKTYDINLPTYGGVIMMLFAPQSTDDNGDDILAFEERRVFTYTEILELTKIPESDLKRQLKSIAVAPRLRLLVKEPMSKDINADDKFMLNHKFKSPTTKVKVLTVKSDPKELSKEAIARNKEAEEVQADIDEGRKHLINAAIVRIMKSRHTMKHNELIEEIIKQLQTRFLPLIIHIKQRIEDLIQKEYLRRNPDTPNVYQYVA